MKKPKPIVVIPKGIPISKRKIKLKEISVLGVRLVIDKEGDV